MDHSSFIITCNVRFLKDAVIFLDEKVRVLCLTKGKMVNLKNPKQPSSSFIFLLLSSLFLSPP